MLTWNITIDIQNRKLIRSTTDGTDVASLTCWQGSTVRLNVQIVAPNTSGSITAPYTVQTLTGHGLAVSVGNPAGTTDAIAFQGTFSISGTNTFVGDLDFNTAAVDALIGSSLEVSTQYVEFCIVDGSTPDYLARIPVTIRAKLYDPANPPTPVFGANNIRITSGQLQIWDTMQLAWRPVGCHDGQLFVGGTV